MFRKIQISFAYIGLLVFLVHGVLPHHHHELNVIECISDYCNGEEHDNEMDHHFPIPAHQHVSASENFDLVRTNLSIESNVPISNPCCFAITNYHHSFQNPELPGQKIKPPIIIPKNSYPFIISPNSMRGSPSVA